MGPWFLFAMFMSLGIAGQQWSYYVAGTFAGICALSEASSNARRAR